MPELPEVETTCRGIREYLLGKEIIRVVVRQPKLRWPVPASLDKRMRGNVVSAITRRGKYILLSIGDGTLLIHLGMSGRLAVVPVGTRAGKHDHADIILDDRVLRFTDPRRFGCVLWVDGDPMQHKLLKKLGPEPLEKVFSAKYLYNVSRQRKVPVKTFIMDSHVVVGVGNIYANEALYLAGIRPQRRAGSLRKDETAALASAIKAVLRKAIQAGGTTLRDFASADGRPGYFQQQLFVYGKGGHPCPGCGQLLKETRTGARSTVFCLSCQE